MSEQKKSKFRKKHLCYYGYSKTPWYQVSCPMCKKVLIHNLPVLIFTGVIIISATFAAFVILLKF